MGKRSNLFVFLKRGSPVRHIEYPMVKSEYDRVWRRYCIHPGELFRLSRAFLKSRLENRGVLPKDLWPLKALIGWGIDTSIYRDLVYKYWGAYPYEFHACTEAGIIAVQSRQPVPVG